MQERRNKMKVPTLVVKFKEYAELDEIKRDAHAHNMNVSEYIRHLLLKEREVMQSGKQNNNTDRH